jgi:hypothetical protein
MLARRFAAGHLLLYVGFRRERIWKTQRQKQVFTGRKRLWVEAAGHLNQFVVRQFPVVCFGLGHEISPSVGLDTEFGEWVARRDREPIRSSGHDCDKDHTANLSNRSGGRERRRTAFLRR